MKLQNKLLIALCTAAVAAPAAHAEKFFGSSSISGLYGDQYEIFGGEQESASVITFENVSAHNWGDSFLFIDRYQVQGDSDSPNDLYGEFAPRLSLGWLTEKDLAFGPIKDVLLAATYEYGGGADANNLLTGFGLSWDLPGLQYFNTNFYHVDNDDAFGTPDDWQTTITWGMPAEVGSARILFDGFIDYSAGVGGAQKAELHVNPQLTLDIGHFSGNPGVMYAGIEYSHWRNKFGSPTIDTENAVSALVKFHF